MPTTTPPTAPAWTPTRTRRSKKRPPTSPPRSRPRAVTVGAKISDVATLSGLVSPSGGAVTFDLYKGADCSAPNKVGATLNATDNAVAANGTFHLPRASTRPPPAPAPTTGSPTTQAMPTTKPPTAPASTPTRTRRSTKTTPTLATTAGPGGVLGAQVSDTAHLSGGVNPTGTITFRLYDNPTCAGTPAAEVTNGSVSGNGDYASPPATPRRRRRLLLGRHPTPATPTTNAAQTGCSDPSEKVTITSPPAAEVEATKDPAAGVQAAQGAGPRLHLHPPQPGAPGDPLRRLHQGHRSPPPTPCTGARATSSSAKRPRPSRRRASSACRRS